MQALLQQQRSNIVPMSSSNTGGSSSSNEGSNIAAALISSIKELTSSIKVLTGALFNQAKVIDVPVLRQPINDKANITDVDSKPVSSKESEIENNRLLQKNMELLQEIADNTKPREVKVEKAEDKESGGFGLGGLLTAVAVAAGTVAGLVSAWVKTIKFFVTGIGAGIEKMVVFLSKWFPSLRKILFNIEVTFVLLVENMKNIFKNAVGSIRTVFSNLVGSISNVFKGALEFFKGIFGEGSGIGKVITAIKTSITNFITPIVEGFKVLQETSAPIGKFFASIKSSIASVFEFFAGFKTFFVEIGSKMQMFGKIFGAVSKIVSKIAWPLMAIMAIWDTVKGAMEGWDEGGFVGMIGGSIKGLFNSLVGGVLDMLKGAISWIAGALGFTAVEEFLDSFSFSDLFGDLVDAILFIPMKIQEFIMSPIETLKKLGSTLADMWDPIKNIMGTLVDVYLFIPRKLFGLVTEYIIDPLMNVFKPVTDFFKGIAKKLTGIFENFGIPEMGFSVFGKKLSIGPFYPFKSDSESKGETKVPEPAAVTIPTSATPVNGVAKSPIVATPTQPLVEKAAQPPAQMSAREQDIQQRMAKTKALVQKGDPNAELTPSERTTMKARGLDPENAADKRLYRSYEQSTGEKLDQSQKLKAIVPAAAPTSADILSKKSSETAALKESMKTAPAGNTIVSAPTVNNTTKQTNVIRVPVRNQDNSVSSWLQSRHQG